MKKLSIIITAIVGVMLSACSDFLDRMPITAPSNETFLSGQDQVRTYVNGLYMTLPALSQFGMGVRSEEKNSDNILSEKYDLRLNGENQIFDGSEEWQDGYKNLRRVNYFFNYYRIAEAQETEDIRSYKGEAYFFRAYWHFYLLTRFGEIPIMDKFWDDQATVAGLQIPASTRTDVAKFILNDLEIAKGLLKTRSKDKGLRISKEAAMAFATRVALYEGTWQKYHKGTNFAKEDNSTYFLEQVMTWGDELFTMGMTLNTQETDKTAKNPGDAFAHLFNMKDLSGVSEALFWKKYSDKDGVFHALLGLISGGVVDTDAPAGLSKSLVDNYLNANGTPINVQDAKFKDFNKTFEGRDSRLTETVMHSGAKYKSTLSKAKPMLVKEYTEADKDIIVSPSLMGSGNGKNVTGFHSRLGIDTTYVSGNSETAFVLIRYAEALLNYAEAAEELGRCTDAVLEKTVKALRERAGVTYIKPAAIDPSFPDFGYTLTPNLQEIRRERRSELSLQGFRFDDLMRWRSHSLIQAKRGRGAYLGHDGVLYKSYNPKDAASVALVLVDQDGWMDPLKEYLPTGYKFRPDQDYLLPIAPDELELNKTLRQNPGNW